ncbi:hypothetical protein, partial [Streptococcus suis]|uniref:hypothetical protein n=1 Tax=Streptococcus suis TaxID=1307 RepID=UPI00209B3640
NSLNSFNSIENFDPLESQSYQGFTKSLAVRIIRFCCSHYTLLLFALYAFAVRIIRFFIKIGLKSSR